MTIRLTEAKAVRSPVSIATAQTEVLWWYFYTLAFPGRYHWYFAVLTTTADIQLGCGVLEPNTWLELSNTDFHRAMHTSLKEEKKLQKILACGGACLCSYPNT